MLTTYCGAARLHLTFVSQLASCRVHAAQPERYAAQERMKSASQATPMSLRLTGVLESGAQVYWNQAHRAV